MPFNALTTIFLLADGYERGETEDGDFPQRLPGSEDRTPGSLAHLREFEDQLGHLQQEASRIGRTAPESWAQGTRYADPLVYPPAPAPEPTSGDELREADAGWRIIIAASPIDAHRFHVNYAERLVAAHRDASSAATKGWQIPGRLARLVRDYLEGAPSRSAEYQAVAGRLGVLALTLLTLQDADERRDLDVADPENDEEARRRAMAATRRRSLAGDLVSLDAVREALQSLYSPQQPEGLLQTDPPANDVPVAPAAGPDRSPREDPGLAEPETERYQRNRTAWNAIAPHELAFLEFGTTSVVLRILDPDPVDDRVLKCVLLTYARLPAVSQATAGYYETYHQLGERDASTVKVHASSENWIIMDRAPGVTLHDILIEAMQESVRTQESRRRSDNGIETLLDGWRVPRLDLVRRYLPPLLEALSATYAAARHTTEPFCHADLNPKNIMVSEDSGRADPPVRVTLIDLGRNYVTGRSVTGAGGSHDIYTAPELPLAQRPDPWCDLYSIGQILIGACGVGRGPERSVPDTLYSVVPTLARLAEDLIDGDPFHRLSSFPQILGTPRGDDSGATDRQHGPRSGSSPFSLDLLKDVLLAEVTALEAAESGTGRLRRLDRVHVLLRLVSPLAGAPGRLRRLRNVRTGESHREPPWLSPGLHRWLSSWSQVSAGVWALSMAVTVLLLLHDCSVPVPLPSAVAAAQRAAGLQDRLSARLTGITFSLCAVKYYQSVYAALTTRGHTFGRAGDSAKQQRAARTTEFWIRGNALIVGALVVPVNLFAPHWWTVATALGITSACAVNFTGYRYAARVVGITSKKAGAGGLLLDKPEDISGLALYRAWGPTMGCYVLIVWIFAALLTTGVLHDVLAYGGVVSGINLSLFYAYKCSMEAEAVRTALTRCYLAAERLA